ncbi:DUF4232 domain-containing protein [Kitasatospora sp. NPDC092948]|uniref:DUF4232 domain-containing protein n=1 Tax=Kitasatospora sp. NPDC092948 TaxID=3364088 RepID=UPI00380B9E77
MSASAVRPALVVTALAVTAAALLVGCSSSAPVVVSGPCGAAPTAPPTGWKRDGVRIVAVNDVCAEFEVTNGGSEAADFSVLFGWTGAGQRLDTNPTGTVTAVPPGATVRGRVEVGHPDPARSAASRPPLVPDVKISQVRSVPTAEAPAQDGPCPASGVRLYADQGDAAMGLRVVGLHLVNCGTSPVTVDGYPQVQALDEKHRPVDALQVLKGGAAIAANTGADTPPQQIVLATGEGVRSTVVWRNTNDDVAAAPVNAPYLRVRATPDAAPVMVTPELDLGTTGRIGVGAWAREGGPRS